MRGSPSVGVDIAAALDGLMLLPGVRQSTVDARVSVDRLLAHRVLRRSAAAVSGESALRGARASAALSGADFPLAAVRHGDVADPVLQGALRVALAVGSMVDTWPRAPLQVLARLHALAAAGQAPAAALGRPRREPEVSARLVGLAALATAPASVPAVLVAAVVHGELLAVQPFGLADGIVARAAARLVLLARGLDPHGVCVPEVGHLELVEDYRVGAYAAGEPEGVAAWLRHCCAATALGAREGLAICESVERG